MRISTALRRSAQPFFLLRLRQRAAEAARLLAQLYSRRAGAVAALATGFVNLDIAAEAIAYPHVTSSIAVARKIDSARDVCLQILSNTTAVRGA